MRLRRARPCALYFAGACVQPLSLNKVQTAIACPCPSPDSALSQSPVLDAQRRQRVRFPE